MLPSTADSPERDLRKACAQLEQRLRAGHECRAEDLLGEFPQVDSQHDHVLELIYTEFVIREELGEQPSPEDLYARFPHLRAELEQLFQVHRFVDGDITAGAYATPRLAGASADTLRVVTTAGKIASRRLGSYEILEEIGRGGMGVVYKARQPALNRVVALKMILAGDLASPEDLARFRTEAEAEASLQHPNIVQIHEVGVQDGRPYLSLEYVDGGSLQQKLSATTFTAKQAAQLSETLARAVHFAHQRGIIHRDLKPANVLLARSDGIGAVPLGTSPEEAGSYEPKVTDFGLSKRILDSTANQTRSGAMLGTPSYMSPEQASGKSHDIGTATDVYALGAILYEILAGRPPFRAESPLETLLQVQTEEPVPPRRLRPNMPRDLETICLKCLHKEPHKRYANALALAEDLRRCRAGEPIQARPVSFWERGWKWARRRPALAALMAVLGAALLGLLCVILLYNRQLLAAVHLAREHEAETRRASAAFERNFERARAAVDRMTGEISQPRWRNDPELEPQRRQLLVEGLNFYKGFLQEKRDDPQVRLQTAQAYFRVGISHAELEDFPAARACYDRALDLLEALAAEFPGNAPYQLELADVLTFLGHVCRRDGNPGRAEELYLRAIKLTKPLLDQTPGNPDCQIHLANVFLNYCVVLRDANRLDEAERAACEAIDLQRKVLAIHPRDPGYRSELALGLEEMTIILMARGKHDLPAAERYCRQALELREQLIKETPEEASYRKALAETYVYLGSLQHQTGHFPEAIKSYRAALPFLEGLARNFPARLSYRESLTNAIGHLARAFYYAGQFDKSRETYRQALSHAEQLLRDPAVKKEGFSRAAWLRHTAAVNANQLAWVLLVPSNQQPATAAEALAVVKKAIDLEPDTATIWNTLAMARYRTGDWKGALQAADHSLAIRGPNSFDHFVQAMAHWRLANRSEARAFYEKAVAARAKTNPDPRQFGYVETEAAVLLEIAKQPAVKKP